MLRLNNLFALPTLGHVLTPAREHPAAHVMGDSSILDTIYEIWCVSIGGLARSVQVPMVALLFESCHDGLEGNTSDIG
jgi:hypothetical protein